MELKVYEHLLVVNAGFDQVLRGLAGLRKHDSFRRREIDRFRALSKEARAATNSRARGAWQRAVRARQMK
jgi:hypothetical protein